MAAEKDDNRETCYRKPSPKLWTATLLVLTYAVWCVVLPILTASGHLLNSQSFECGNSDELFGSICILFVIMVISFTKTWEKETQEKEMFKKHYLALKPLRDLPGNTQTHLNDTNCPALNNVHRWQAEFKCCGLEGYQDWGSAIPDSCLCEGEDDRSGCVGVGDILIYEKPCLPTVLSLEQEGSSMFWPAMIVWMTITGALIFTLVLLVAVFCCVCSYWLYWQPCCYALRDWIYTLSGREVMVPVVFIRKNNNNQKQEENGKDGEVKESGVNESVVLDTAHGTTVEGEVREAKERQWDDNVMSMIPLSELRRLQEELDPPPIQHHIQGLCVLPCTPKSFYLILIEEGSPLLPSNAVLADPDKPSTCYWAEGHHSFFVEDTVWPKDITPQGTPPSWC
ncbi:uncharacterized protein LOC121176191 isoform X2 [Toxotes jaculatrix]|uniref:uncharacterized protein LOC121176191 isoform X2 n=1 Tax=Toxotes jaculatrix TaxID=941984 RepID=UPI001B3AC65B|nr:uncharacterized protein LOC121176191 isoform X2 [Toxotes jaculatrix]